MATEEDNEPYKWYCRHEPYQLLITAMQIRNIQWISYLIRSGKVDPNLWDGTEPLLFVFIDSSFSLPQKKELIRLAVAHGADIHVKDKECRNILQWTNNACVVVNYYNKYGYTEHFRELIGTEENCCVV